MDGFRTFHFASLILLGLQLFGRGKVTTSGILQQGLSFAGIFNMGMGLDAGWSRRGLIPLTLEVYTILVGAMDRQISNIMQSVGAIKRKSGPQTH